MRIRSFLLAILLVPMVVLSCKKDTPKTEAKAITFDYKAFVDELNTPYKDFVTKYKENTSIQDDYSSVTILKGVYVVGEEEYNLNIIATADRYGLVDRIVAQPVDSDDSKDLWNFFMDSSASLGLGDFASAKYKTLNGSGTIGSFDEARSFFGDNYSMSATFMTAFEYAGGDTRIVLFLGSGSFSFLIMDNYLTLDESVLRGWPGATYTDLVSLTYTIAEERDKSLFFKRAVDPLGNEFVAEAFLNEKNGKVKTVDAVLNESSWDQVLTVWKSYAKPDAILGLGTLKTVKVFKDGKEQSGVFDTADDMLADLEEHGRPTDAVYELSYAKDTFFITVTLGADAMTLQGLISE